MTDTKIKCKRVVVRNIRGKLLYVSSQSKPRDFYWIQRLSEKGKYRVCETGKIREFELDLNYYKGKIGW